MLRKNYFMLLSVIGVALLSPLFASAQIVAEDFDTVIKKVLEEGKKAYDARNYDLAIAKFQEGYEINEDFLGTAPAFLNYKGVALKLRATDSFNYSVKSSDKALRAELRQKAAKDFEDALVVIVKSLNLVENGNPGRVKLTTIKKVKTDALKFGREIVNLMIRAELTTDSVKEDAKLIINEYVKNETDNAKKLKAQNDLGIFLTRTFDYDGAFVAYRKALEIDSNDSDALVGLGVSLYLASEVNGDTQQYQEGLNYLQYYLDRAPKDHTFREDIQDLVDEHKAQKLKSQNNLQ